MAQTYGAYIKEHSTELKKAAADKYLEVDIDALLVMDDERKKALQEVEDVRRRRNEIAQALKSGKNDALVAEGKELKEKTKILEDRLQKLETDVNDLLARVPNIPSDTSPRGRDDKENVEASRWGAIPQFDFPIKDHVALGESLDLLDLKTGVEVSGFRGYYLKNELALMHVGLMWLGLRKMVSRGFVPHITPTLVRGFGFYGSGHFPFGKDEVYQIGNPGKLESGEADVDPLYLAGTAEVPLLAAHANKTYKESDLPLKLCGFSQCYRSEIGSYGKDTKGLYRIHEFMKVEQVIICRADLEESKKFFEELRSISEELLQDLELPYRVLEICTGDMGAGKYRQNDIETWMPSRNAYGETHSNSNLTDWQARRLNLQYKDTKGETHYAYTLNNTVVASPRILIAILENNQQKDGSVRVPKALQEFVGKDVLRPRF